MSVHQALSLVPRPELSTLCLATIEHSPLPMAAVDGLTHILRYGNPAFCNLMSQRLEDLVGRPFHELLPTKDVCISLLDRVLETGHPEMHVEEERSQARPIFWSYTMWPVQADEPLVGVMIQVTESAKRHNQTIAMNEALVLGSVRQHELVEATESLNEQLRREIAERKEAQEALQRAKALLADRALQLEEAVAERTTELTATNNQLETFVYSIAHDLRAPLRAMQGFTTMLVEDEKSLSATGKDYAEKIKSSATRMDDLLGDMLAFARVAKQSADISASNLRSVVETAIARMEQSLQAHNGQLEFVGASPTVLAHEPTLIQVLINLISNSLKFVPPGISPRIRLRAEDAGEFVRVWVEDNGIGILPEHQHQIFKLFTRVHGEKYPGTGVGLAIVEKGIERMGGRVGVESTAGRGARFWFELRKAT
jgi:signal transduction histidine kinase